MKLTKRRGRRYSSEVFPTELRSRGSGLANASVRMGGVVAPFVGVYVQNQSQVAAFLVHIAIDIAGAVATAFIKTETAGQGLSAF